MSLPPTKKDDEKTVSAVQGCTSVAEGRTPEATAVQGCTGVAGGMTPEATAVQGRAQAKGSTSVAGERSEGFRTPEATATRPSNKTSLSKGRNLARRCAVQALYQWHITQQNVGDIDAQFVTEHDVKKVDIAYFQELLHQVPEHVTELDAHYALFLDRPVRELDPVECAILRMSVYELAHRLDIPYRVVINEGVDMAKVFGAEQSHKYVNGVLDKVARKLRAAEIQMKFRKPST